MQEIVAAISGPEFIRGIALLLVTAAVAGFLVPQIVAILADRRQKSQKVFEADLARQRDVLAAQSELLRNLSKIAWRFQLMNINVSFCRLESDAENYIKARDRYQAESAELLGQLRAEISTSQRLVSAPMYTQLRALYFETLLPVDAGLESLIRKDASASRQEWLGQHDRSFNGAQSEIDRVLTELAVELQLTAPAVRTGGA